MSSTSSSEPVQRIELTLRKPPLGWYPRPTVVFEGRGHPVQWGTGTWRVPAGGNATVKVILFNRLWVFGKAEVTVHGPAVLEYSAPWLPFLPGRLSVVGTER